MSSSSLMVTWVSRKILSSRPVTSWMYCTHERCNKPYFLVIDHWSLIISFIHLFIYSFIHLLINILGSKCLNKADNCKLLAKEGECSTNTTVAIQCQKSCNPLCSGMSALNLIWNVWVAILNLCAYRRKFLCMITHRKLLRLISRIYLRFLI